MRTITTAPAFCTCLPRVWLWVFASVLLACAPALAADLVLVEDGQNPAPIYCPAGPGQERSAAADLAGYLSRISGAKFVVAAAPADLPTRGVFVGRLPGAPGENLAPDAFRIRAEGERLFIVGGNAQGTYYGVFALLEQLGCRWWSNDEEDVPTRKTLTLPRGDTTTAPVFSLHDLFNREAQNATNRFNMKSRGKSTEDFSGGHTLYPLLTPYAQTHPEIYPADKKGARKGNKLHFCYLAPGIAEALADALAKQVEANRRELKNTIYFAGMGDWYGGMCECEKCQAVYKAETWTNPDGKKIPGYTATLLTMINRTAEILEQKYPGIRVGTFAYMSLEAPPATIKPRENVVIRVPRLRHCTVHAADECDKNRGFLLNLQRWCELAPGRTYVWEYGANFQNFVRPFPCLYSMAKNLKVYHQMGVRGVEIQGNYTSTGGDLAVLKNYVLRKVFADPSLDPHELLVEFCNGYFGPAASEMIAYVDTLEKSVREPKPIHANEFAAPSYLTPEVTAALTKLRDEAKSKTAGAAPYDRRVSEATIGLGLTRIWRTGPLEEQGDKLIRKDIGRYTYPEAVDAIKHLRGAAATEWSGGKAQQLALLVMQGGPLALLSGGEVSVKVAPVMNGMIRQISFRGKDLLYVEKNERVKGYPQLGGSREFLNTRAMELDGEPSASKVAMRGEGGVSLFGGVSTSEVSKTVEVAGDGTIVTRGSQKAVKGAPPDSRATTIQTVYAVGKKSAGLRVEYLTQDNQWKQLELTAEKTSAAIPHIASVRITLPEQACVVTDTIVAPASRVETTTAPATEDVDEPVEAGSIEEDAVPVATAPSETPKPAANAPGTATLDMKTRTLNVTVRTPYSPAVPKGEQILLERRLTIRPMDATE